MLDRRRFLAASGLGMAAIASGGWSGSEIDSTWLTYSPDLELFWGKLPFLERLRKLSETGVSRYEFGRWKTKDFGEIIKKNEELNIQAAIFNGCPGLKGAKWKEQLVESVEESAILAAKLGASKIGVIAPDRNEKLDRADQVDDFVEALKDSLEKLADSEVALILEPVRPVANRPASLVTTTEEASSVIKAVSSGRVKFTLNLDQTSIVGGKLPELIRQNQGQIGYYRLTDFAPPALADEARYVQVIRAIHDAGYQDPIGLGLASKVDPMVAIESIRKLDAAAKAL